MRVLTADPPPPQVEAYLEHRRHTGADRRDEIWDGVLHMAPAPQRRHGAMLMRLASVLQPFADATQLELIADFNLGEELDYRIPDAGLLRPGANAVFLPSAAMAVEIVSPGDETSEKLPFYAAHDVDEVLILDPEARTVHWLALTGDEYQPVQRSGLIDLGPGQLSQLIAWPADG